MLSELEFRQRYEAETPMLLAWGNFVAERISDELGKTVCLGTFIKLPVNPRLKNIDSLLSKASRPGKNYTDPYLDITDKIGIRFVVLLSANIETVSAVIQNDSMPWRASLDKDYLQERDQFPERFTYESKHFVVYNTNEFRHNSVVIAINTPCEIQIRTLLQHAYAEMSHDSIYKSNVVVDPCVKRYMARSMALVESADHFFAQASKELHEKSTLHNQWDQACRLCYPIKTVEHNDNANMFLIDAFIPQLKSVSIEKFAEYCVQRKDFFSATLPQRLELSWIYRQPAVLIIYFLINHHKAVLHKLWPVSEQLLTMLLTDLGETPMYQG